MVGISNGVDTDLFRPGLDGTPVRRQHGIADDVRVLVFVGTLDRAHHFKGVSYLLKALSFIGDHKVMLMIIGDGDLRRQFMTLAGNLGLSKQTFFAGALSHEMLSGYYAAADVLILPSLPPESFGLVLIEAMACGRPVIASNLPGVRSVVSDGEDGLLVRPGDVEDLAEKMRMLLNDPQRRREMGERGRAKVEEKYAWPKIISRLAQVYEEVLVNATSGR